MSRPAGLLMLVAALGVFYSGLFLLDIAPGRPPDSFRFWNGGDAALRAGGAIDLAAGIPLLVTAAAVVLNPSRIQRLWKILAPLYVAGLVGDLIAGIYGIMAQIGLYTTIATRLRRKVEA
ncbi:MAG: hypothetical protein NZ570_03540 [Candidatus Caldarchaeum sp.]|nr:hypothetical protein [Candidatus Caldarchaeum sp.]